MKKTLALALTAAFVLAGATALGGDAFADKTQTQKAAKEEKGQIKGTISEWNDSAKTFKVKDEGGQETALVWNDQTKVHGTARVGGKVKVKTVKQDGQVVATEIHVDEK